MRGAPDTEDGTQLPSGVNLRRVAIGPRPRRPPTERPSASTYQEDENVAEASAMKMDLLTPLFQPPEAKLEEHGSPSSAALRLTIIH